MESIITQNSITFTELEYCRHEYLRLLMSDAFNDQNFTILNKWIQQCSHHQDCLRKEPIIVQDSIILIELEDYRSKYLWLWLSGVFNDHKFTILNEWSQQLNQYQHSSQSGVTNNLKSIIFTELQDYMHESLRLWKSGFFNDQNFTILN